MSKTSELMKKVSIALTGGIAISTLTGCGSGASYESTDDSQVYYETSQSNYESEQTDDSYEEETVYEEETEYEDETVYDDTIEYSTDEMPYDENCADWELDEEDAVWMCNDHTSSYYGNFFFMGSYFATKNMLYSNNQFNQYKSTVSVNGASSSTSTTKSGFGSGVTGGFGG